MRRTFGRADAKVLMYIEQHGHVQAHMRYVYGPGRVMPAYLAHSRHLCRPANLPAYRPVARSPWSACAHVNWAPVAGSRAGIVFAVLAIHGQSIGVRDRWRRRQQHPA